MRIPCRRIGMCKGKYPVLAPASGQWLFNSGEEMEYSRLPGEQKSSPGNFLRS